MLYMCSLGELDVEERKSLRRGGIGVLCPPEREGLMRLICKLQWDFVPSLFGSNTVTTMSL